MTHKFIVLLSHLLLGPPFLVKTLVRDLFPRAGSTSLVHTRKTYFTAVVEDFLLLTNKTKTFLSGIWIHDFVDEHALVLFELMIKSFATAV